MGLIGGSIKKTKVTEVLPSRNNSVAMANIIKLNFRLLVLLLSKYKKGLEIYKTFRVKIVHRPKVDFV